MSGRPPHPPHVLAAMARPTVQLKLQGGPSRPAAPHVQAAHSRVAQARLSGPGPSQGTRAAAVHVQRAVGHVPVQAKVGPPSRLPAPHVQAAVQAKPGLASPGPAPHVRAAVVQGSRVAPALQRKPAAPLQPARVPPAPVRRGGVIQRKSEFSNHIVRHIVESAASESGLLEKVSLSSSWIMALEGKFFSDLILPKNDTSEAREALSWLTSQIVKQEYPEARLALPFLQKVLLELRDLELEGLFDQNALRGFALHVANVRGVANGIIEQRLKEYVEDLEGSEDEEDEENEMQEEASFENNLKLGAPTGTRVYRRRGSFTYSTSKGDFKIPGTQSQIDLHKKIVALQQPSFRGNRVKVRVSLFWVAEEELQSVTLSETVSEKSTFRSAEYLSGKEQLDLIPQVSSLLKVVKSPIEDPFNKKKRGNLLHSERDLVVKLDQIKNFAGELSKEILTKAPKGSKLLILALEVHSCKNKVCSRCNSVLRSLSQGGWKNDVKSVLKDYDISEFGIIVRAGSDEGGGEEIAKLTKVTKGTLVTFTPEDLPCILDIQPLDRLKYFDELKEFSDQLK